MITCGNGCENETQVFARLKRTFTFSNVLKRLSFHANKKTVSDWLRPEYYL